MSRQIGPDYQAQPAAVLEFRVHALERRVAVLEDAVRVLREELSVLRADRCGAVTAGTPAMSGSGRGEQR